jgi:serine phosphatase RsbU (regulator of sigma subunit)
MTARGPGDSMLAPLPIARQRRADPLDEPVWRLCWITVTAGVIAAAVKAVLGTHAMFAVWLVAAAALTSWVAAVRMLLLDTRWRRFWRIWLLVSVLPTLAGGAHGPGLGLAIAGAAIFLTLRSYNPYRHLSSARRAKLFCVGIVALALLFPGYSKIENPSWFTGLGQSLARYAIISLRIFWIFTLDYIFFRMRLHFLRLKPKLAAAALFIAIIPLVLLLTLGAVAFYSVLGASLASRGRATVLDWLKLLGQHEEIGASLFGDGFVYAAAPPGGGSAVVGGGSTAAGGRSAALGVGRAAAARGAAAAALTVAASGVQAPPAWIDRLNAAVAARAAGSDAERASLPDTTALFEVEGEAWALRLHSAGTPRARISGHRIEPPFMDRLARILQRDTALVGGTSIHSGGTDKRGNEGVQISINDTTGARTMVKGRAHPPPASADSSGVAAPAAAAATPAARVSSLWRRDLYFGAAALPTYRLAGTRLVPDNVLLTLKTRPVDLWEEFSKGENEINRAILVLLGTLATIFLVLEGLALFFGIRITTGITSATHALHDGTLRLARGDLDTQIDIPNEDEFGDLADSFNEMTAAVRRGREETVARELLEREIGTARQIQQRLLPAAMPRVAGFEIAGTSVPSRKVGGDYFDFIELPGNRLGVAIGDVSGKGIPAALLMANLQACLQGQVIHPSGVGEVVRRVNNLLVNSTDAEMFATFFYGVLDRTTGEITASNAGHDPPLLFRADGSIQRLSAGGLLLGMFPGVSYEEETAALLPGDVLVLYTDGIPEAIGPPLPAGSGAAAQAAAATGAAGQAAATGHAAAVASHAADGAGTAAADDDAPDPHANFFEEERLIAVIETHRDRSAQQIQEAILAAVAQHTAGIPQSDDITLVVIKRLVSSG